MSLRRRARWVAEYVAGRAALGAVSMLPERLAYAAAAGLGRLFFRCSKRRQACALRILRNALPEADDRERLRLARIATGNVFKVTIDMVRVGPAIRRGRLHDAIDLGGVPADVPDPPFLAVTAHLGSWEIAGIACAMLKGEAHAIARVFKNPLLQRWLLASREQAGLFIHPKRGGIRGLAAALERGCVGMQVVDQHQRLRGVRVPFFGQLASTERSAAALSLRKGYPIVVGAAVRVGAGFRFKLLSDSPLRVVPSGDHEADVKRVAAEVNRRLERLILAHPEQYLWIHDRYRDAPGTAPAASTSPAAAPGRPASGGA